MADGMEKVSIAWHPAFCSATEFELRDSKESLVFEAEHSLSKEPLRIDLLVIKKRKEAVIENDVARIFRKYNVIEYKSPDDGLTIDDLYKTIGYACILKGTGKTVNEIDEGDVTVSLFREAYPQALMEHLRQKDVGIRVVAPGVYYVDGNQFPVQIVVTGELDSKKHFAYKILSRTAQRADVEEFLRVADNLESPGDLQIVDSILQVSVTVNRELYQEIKEDEVMCEALRDLMKDEIAEKVNEEKMRDKQDTAKRMRDRGVVDSMIAEFLDVSEETVRKWLEYAAC